MTQRQRLQIGAAVALAIIIPVLACASVTAGPLEDGVAAYCAIFTGSTIQRLAKTGNPNLVAVRQEYSGSFSGSALLIFLEASSLELMRAILGRQIALSEILDLEDEALAETGNIILNSWVGTIANLLKEKLKMSLPAVLRSDQRRIFENVRRQELVCRLSSYQVRHQ